MNAIRKSIGSLLILGAAAGCAGESEPSPAPSADGPKPSVSAPPPKITNATPDAFPETVSKPKGDDGIKVEAPKAAETATKLSAEEIKGIKELPAAEQDTAIAQAVCPVSTHNLGSMGMPLKVTAEGRTLYLCCDSCEKDFKADPKKFIAKLDKAKDAK
jgi:YHS domain-containing protein